MRRPGLHLRRRNTCRFCGLTTDETLISEPDPEWPGSARGRRLYHHPECLARTEREHHGLHFETGTGWAETVLALDADNVLRYDHGRCLTCGDTWTAGGPLNLPGHQCRAQTEVDLGEMLTAIRGAVARFIAAPDWEPDFEGDLARLLGVAHMPTARGLEPTWRWDDHLTEGLEVGEAS